MIRIRAWLQLTRIGNVFTALADVLAGGLFVGAEGRDFVRLLPLGIASALMYTAGMILNDVFDVRKDLIERPHRPLPSKAISLRAAGLVGGGMLFAGSGLAAALAPSLALCSSALVVTIVAYDGLLKRTSLAPAIMGLCRTLNLALGMLAIGTPWRTGEYLAVAAVWLYVTSVTSFARREAQQSSRLRLTAGWLGMTLAVVVLGSIREFRPAPAASLAQVIAAVVLLCGVISRFAGRAVRSGAPADVQATVKVAIFGIIVFDAILVLIARGPIPALGVACLLPPTIIISAWIRPT